MTGSHHPRAEALKASHARLATVTPARDAGGCPGLAGRRARAPRSWLHPASAPTTHELFPGSAIAAWTASSQRHLYCPRGPSREDHHGERPRKREGCAGAQSCERQRGRGERKVSQKPRPLAAAGAPALGPRGVPRPPRRSVAFVVPGAPWRSGRALRRPRAASVRQVRPRRHHRAPTCGGAAEPRGGREGRQREGEVGGGRPTRRGRGAAVAQAAVPGSTASWLRAPDRAG